MASDDPNYKKFCIPPKLEDISYQVGKHNFTKQNMNSLKEFCDNPPSQGISKEQHTAACSCIDTYTQWADQHVDYINDIYRDQKTFVNANKESSVCDDFITAYQNYQDSLDKVYRIEISPMIANTVFAKPLNMNNKNNNIKLDFTDSTFQNVFNIISKCLMVSPDSTVKKWRNSVDIGTASLYGVKKYNGMYPLGPGYTITKINSFNSSSFDTINLTETLTADNWSYISTYGKQVLMGVSSSGQDTVKINVAGLVTNGRAADLNSTSCSLQGGNYKLKSGEYSSDGYKCMSCDKNPVLSNGGNCSNNNNTWFTEETKTMLGNLLDTGSGVCNDSNKKYIYKDLAIYDCPQCKCKSAIGWEGCKISNSPPAKPGDKSTDGKYICKKCSDIFTNRVNNPDNITWTDISGNSNNIDSIGKEINACGGCKYNGDLGPNGECPNPTKGWEGCKHLDGSTSKPGDKSYNGLYECVNCGTKYGAVSNKDSNAWAPTSNVKGSDLVEDLALSLKACGSCRFDGNMTEKYKCPNKEIGWAGCKLQEGNMNVGDTSTDGKFTCVNCKTKFGNSVKSNGNAWFPISSSDLNFVPDVKSSLETGCDGCTYQVGDGFKCVVPATGWLGCDYKDGTKAKNGEKSPDGYLCTTCNDAFKYTKNSGNVWIPNSPNFSQEKIEEGLKSAFNACGGCKYGHDSNSIQCRPPEPVGWGGCKLQDNSSVNPNTVSNNKWMCVDCKTQFGSNVRNGGKTWYPYLQVPTSQSDINNALSACGGCRYTLELKDGKCPPPAPVPPVIPPSPARSQLEWCENGNCAASGWWTSGLCKCKNSNDGKNVCPAGIVSSDGYKCWKCADVLPASSGYAWAKTRGQAANVCMSRGAVHSVGAAGPVTPPLQNSQCSGNNPAYCLPVLANNQSWYAYAIYTGNTISKFYLYSQPLPKPKFLKNPEQCVNQSRTCTIGFGDKTQAALNPDYATIANEPNKTKPPSCCINWVGIGDNVNISGTIDQLNSGCSPDKPSGKSTNNPSDSGGGNCKTTADCNNKGMCADNRCICSTGWSGNNCQINLNPSWYEKLSTPQKIAVIGGASVGVFMLTFGIMKLIMAKKAGLMIAK